MTKPEEPYQMTEHDRADHEGKFLPAADPPQDDMCPNCVTPWKCNGPHGPPQDVAHERINDLIMFLRDRDLSIAEFHAMQLEIAAALAAMQKERELSATTEILDLTPVGPGKTVDDVLFARGEYDKAMAYRAKKEREWDEARELLREVITALAEMIADQCKDPETCELVIRARAAIAATRKEEN